MREAGEEKADQVIAFTQMCVVADLDTETAIAAAEICRVHRLATADAIVYATARAHAADVLTCNGQFNGLDGVTLIRKPVP
jgi:predicted nucleic acid-binding protein